MQRVDEPPEGGLHRQLGDFENARQDRVSRDKTQLNGEQAIPLIKALRPEVPIILSSGFSEAELSHRFESSGISDFLQKPYRVPAILSKVRQHLELLTG